MAESGLTLPLTPLNYCDFVVKDEDRKLLTWENFNCWIKCFCIVTFDLELGQVIEKTFPNHVELDEKERANVCYLAFPDSNTGCMGDTQFHFRIRLSPSSAVEKVPRNTERELPVYLRKDSSHYYGFVFFRQVKDPSLKRGYFQKSVVLLSQLPYVNLFSHLIKMIAPEYFENGDAAMETVCYQMDKWSLPCPGQTLQLPLLGSVLQLRIPSKKDKPGAVASPEKEIGKQVGIPLQIFPNLNEINIFKAFIPVLPHIHLLWELVLLGEPVVVMAPTPKMCSETIQALVGLILPLRYSCDFRPYFTIHDSDFKEYTTKTRLPPPVLLGVTNPFFAKTLQQWPHIIRVGEMPTLTITRSTGPGPSGRKEQQLKQGVYTKYKPMLERDKQVLKRLAKGYSSARPLEAQNALLRRHFVELTQSFMIPLERYISSLMPLQRSISPWRSPPKLKQFDTESFLRTLGNFGPQLTSKLKGNWNGLYRKFFQSPNFEGWFRNRREEINQKLEILHLEAICNALSARSSKLPVVMRRKLNIQLNRVLGFLQPDLQLVLRQS
ncbi:protein DENND6A-like isoform X2 [Rhopilema esculentum]|uniref:protein DENND6A-like isoform X2 n=1 Tax=Rhopilema esculentum TaxID=499914 RepID=UPI0031E35DAA